VLYKDGPPFYHASYIVVVEVADADSLVINPTMSTRSMTWDSLFGLQRLSETAAKVNIYLSISSILSVSSISICIKYIIMKSVFLKKHL